MNNNCINLGGISTYRYTRQDLADQMLKDCKSVSDRPKLVFSSNGQGIALCGRSNKFEYTMSQADIVHADGMSVVLASKLLGDPLPERIATTDFFHDAAKIAEENGLNFYILGASVDQNERAVANIKRMYPKLNIVGYRSGYFDEVDSDRVCQEILRCKTDVLWLGLGKPKQEYWALKYRDKLRGVAWIKTCGGLYSFLSGDAKRAPLFMQNYGMEWLYRVSKEPLRLTYRYLWTNPYSLYRLFRYSKIAK